MSAKAEYIPGTCNIGPQEIRARRNGAIFSGALMLALIVFLPMIHVHKIWRLVLFIPASAFGVSFLQWYNKFCVGFGMKGIFNFGELGKTFTVEQKEDYRKDRTKAQRMIIQGIGFGLLLAIVFYTIPI